MDAATRFEALFRAHYPAVRRYAHHRAINGSDADDLVAETFLVAWRRLDVVPPDEPLPWLLAVAANVHRNQARSQRRHMALVDRAPRPDPTPPPREPSDGPAQIRAALAGLSPDDRELLLLVAWDGLTPQQASIVIGTSAGVARLRLHRARKRFAARFDAAQPTARKRGESDGQFLDDRPGETPPARRELSHERALRF
jgi:RNA polymerase sigma factor (sigma-70 family)